MTSVQQVYIQALSDVRSWHRLQIGQALGDMRVVQVHESAIAWLDVLIATKRQHAAEDEAERQRARVAPDRDIQRLTRQGLEAGSLGERQAINMDNLGCCGQISFKKLFTEHLKAKGYLK